MRVPPRDLADIRISVMGTRGKTSLALMLYSVLHRRGRHAICKVSGALPMLCMNTECERIPRRGSVRLYENMLEVRDEVRYDVAVFENQGTNPYTTRVFNEAFLRPDVVLITNVRLDHVEWFGRERERIADALSRTYGSNAKLVITGEKRESVARRLASGVKLVVVEPPKNVPGSEIPAIVNEVLLRLGFDGIDVLEGIRRIEEGLRWEESRDIRFFDASKVNDPDSASELIRWLGGRPILALQLRRDRPGRTWAFLKMVRERWVETSGVVVAGDWAKEFARRVEGIAVSDNCNGADEVLLIAKDRGEPLFITGNRTGRMVRCLLSKLGLERRVPLIYGKIEEIDGRISLPWTEMP